MLDTIFRNLSYMSDNIAKNVCPHVTKLAKFKLPSCPKGMFWNTLCSI